MVNITFTLFTPAYASYPEAMMVSVDSLPSLPKTCTCTCNFAIYLLVLFSRLQIIEIPDILGISEGKDIMSQK